MQLQLQPQGSKQNSGQDHSLNP